MPKKLTHSILPPDQPQENKSTWHETSLILHLLTIKKGQVPFFNQVGRSHERERYEGHLLQKNIEA